MRRPNSRTMWTSRPRSKSKCSATEPASEFSIGTTAPSTVPRLTRSKTSSERAHGTTFALGNIASAASWLKEPSSPWIAIFMKPFPLHSGNRNRPACTSSDRRPRQLLRHHQSVHLTGIVSRNRLFHEVSFLLVEADRGRIIHRRPQRPRAYARPEQLLLRRSQQSRTNARSPRLRDHIDVNDVPTLAASLRHDET